MLNDTNDFDLKSKSKPDFYELKDLENLKPLDSRYFVCNSCRHWNLVKEENLNDIFKPVKRTKRKDVHMKLQTDFATLVKKLSINFGGYEPMLLHLINNFYKSQPEEKTVVTNNNVTTNTIQREIQPQSYTSQLQSVSSRQDSRNDTGDGSGNREIRSSQQR